MLSEKAIVEYQQHHERIYGKTISKKQAANSGAQLLQLFKIIYKPINNEKEK